MIGWIKKHIYWALALAVLIVAIVAVGGYAWNFRELAISTDTGKWADFATYLSGTVGVAAVVATLMAFVITLRQQKRLIDSQDEMLEQQDRQIVEAERHQRKLEAYSRAEIFFPVMLEACMKDMDVVVSEALKRRGWPASYSDFTDPGMKLRDYFNDDTCPPALEKSGRLYFSCMWGEFLIKPYDLAVLVAECLSDAPELRSYFLTRLSDYRRVIACVLIFHYKINPEKVGFVSEMIGYPLDYSGLGVVEAKWQEIGNKCYGNQPARQ